MNFKQLLVVAVSAMMFGSCQKDNSTNNVNLDDDLVQAMKDASGGVGISQFTLPMSSEFSKIPQDPNNPLTQEKINLGSLLYHETGLGLHPMHTENEGNYSCATCHFASAGFQAGRHQAISDGGVGFSANGEGRMPNPLYDLSEIDVQPLRSPSTLNSAYQKVNLWNGQFGATGPNAGTESLWTPGTPLETNTLGYEGLETQAIAALSVHRMELDETVCQQYGYDDLFDAVFPNVPVSERYNKEHGGLAIAAYERSLLANQAPFQLWLRGSLDAMTDQEKEGAILFFGKANCASCHNGPNLANMDFMAIGTKDLYETAEPTYGASADSDANLGRYSFTKVDADKYKFKVPQLYNLTDSPFYGHGASFRTVRDVVVYKNNGVKENANVPDNQLDEGFKPLGLSSGEVDAITAFLENALNDPNLLRYQPLSVRSGNCFPANDPQSRIDLGCN